MPASVSSQKSFAARKVRTSRYQPDRRELDTSSLPSTTLASSHTSRPHAQPDAMPSRGSVDSSSVYSECSSILASGQGGSQECTFILDAEVTSSDSKAFRHNSADEIATQSIHPIKRPKPSIPPDLLPRKPVQSYINLTKSSLADQSQTFLFDHSSSETKPPSSSHTSESTDVKGTPDDSFDKSSETNSSSQSLEDTTESKKARLLLLFAASELISLAAGRSTRCEREGSKAAWPRVREVGETFPHHRRCSPDTTCAVLSLPCQLLQLHHSSPIQDPAAMSGAGHLLESSRTWSAEFP